MVWETSEHYYGGKTCRASYKCFDIEADFNESGHVSLYAYVEGRSVFEYEGTLSLCVLEPLLIHALDEQITIAKEIVNASL